MHLLTDYLSTFTCPLQYILGLAFYSLVISWQNAGERLRCFQRECWFEIASSCFGEFPGCFEACTPLSVLTLTQRATAAAIYTSCGRIGFPHVTVFFSVRAMLSLESGHCGAFSVSEIIREVKWKPLWIIHAVVISTLVRASFQLPYSKHIWAKASLTILSLYWFSGWNLCCFSVGPPTVALTASPTGG